MPRFVAAQQDAEADWDGLMMSLRNYMANRALDDDGLRKEEGRELLRPLFDVLLRLRRKE